MAKKAQGKKAPVKRVATKKAAPKRNPNLLKAVEIGARQQAFSHPWNPNSEMFGVQLGQALGLKRIAVNIARLPPGHESYVPHTHRREEEWIYILMGEGLARLGDQQVPVGMGDFLAYPAPQVVHQLKNVGAEDLVYLMGGERLAMDVVDFPDHGKTMVWVDGAATAYDSAAGTDPFAPPKGAKPAKKK